MQSAKNPAFDLLAVPVSVPDFIDRFVLGFVIGTRLQFC